MAYKPYVGDIGTIIEIDMQEDISAATVRQFKIKKPKSTGGTEEKTWTAILYGTNKLRYTTISGDFDVAGVYYIQPYLELSGWKGKGDATEFRVYAAYEE